MNILKQAQMNLNHKKWREKNLEHYRNYMKNYMNNYRKQENITCRSRVKRGTVKLEHGKPLPFKVTKKKTIIYFS
tara:strand:+ start:1109 stop:1333 length:225 start_codon:yes stop_codon:yes gene_type:complete